VCGALTAHIARILGDPYLHERYLHAEPGLAGAPASRLPRGSQAVLDALRAAGVPLGTGDISELVALSRPATQIRLKALAEANLIRWAGKSAKDPRAVWELLDK